MTEEQTTNNLSDEVWQAILKACMKCKWILVIKHIMRQENKPQELEEIDKILKQNLRFETREILYPSNKALISLNGYLSKANIPYRIKQITHESNCYKGTIQIVKQEVTCQRKITISLDEISSETLDRLMYLRKMSVDEVMKIALSNLAE